MTNSLPENDHQNDIELELSAWWGAGAFGLFAIGGAFLIARTQGSEAVLTLMQASLMLIFLVGGILLGLLCTQALGASQRWQLSEEFENDQKTENPKTARLQVSSQRKSIPSHATGDDEEIDPFYEILKRNHSDKKVA